MANINSLKPNQLFSICDDTECESSLIDRKFLASQRPNYASHVLRKSKPLKVNDIESSKLSIDEYIVIDFTISDEVNGKTTNARFTRYVYIVEDLKANILLNNDILRPKNIVIHIGKQKLTIGSCGDFSVSLKVVARDDERVNRTIRSQADVLVPIHTCMPIFIKLRDSKLPNDRDMMFNSSHIERLRKKNKSFSHIVNANFCAIQVRNATDTFIVITRNERLNTLIDYEEEKCYLASSEVRHLAADS